jgi:mannose-6-phosphate isomerase-like protein (cupin superfamily)
MADKKYVFPTSKTVHYRFPTHTNDLIMDRSEAAASEAFLVILEPGEAPPLHVHHDTEQVFYAISGAGELQISAAENDAVGQRFPVAARDLVRIPPSTWHRIFCRGDEPLVYLSVDCFLGGRPAAEPTWESHVRVMCEANGWDFERVRGAHSVGRPSVRG